MKTDVEVLFMSDLPSRAVSVYLILRTYADKSNRCYPSLKTISNASGLSVSTVKRAIADLEKTGFIKTENRFRSSGAKTSNLYKLRYGDKVD